MATDIAFAVGVLSLLGARAPSGLKVVLLSLAIVDDIGAILVIALFYSSGVSVPALGIAAGLVGAIVALQRLDVRATLVYVALGVGVWLAFLESGVHPTIAGVVLGLVTPTVPFQRPKAVSAEAVRTAEQTVDDPQPPHADSPQWLRLAWLSREAVSPLVRLEEAMHAWTSHVVVPLFAFANTGVVLSADALRQAATSRITIGVVTGLVAGKVLGIVGASALAVRSGVGRLPDDVGWASVTGTAAVAGIGFTVSIFVTDLAFRNAALATQARIGIFAASLLAGVLGAVVFRVRVSEQRLR